MGSFDIGTKRETFVNKKSLNYRCTKTVTYDRFIRTVSKLRWRSEWVVYLVCRYEKGAQQLRLGQVILHGIPHNFIQSPLNTH